ncbi:MAG: sugar nucleotide-binding protein [Deltaproteobacteria bacterium]|nr:sugar nucleotide-binding protein [Deltaproteobacteria bacterium]
MAIVVLGGTGNLGTLVTAELSRRGETVRALGRKDGDARDPEVVARHAHGASAIVNCAGASVAMALGHGWRGYRAVDTPIGMASIEAARRTGARLVYVAVAHAPELASCTYIAAHEQVAAAMSDLDGVVIRPTGLFSAYASLLPLARKKLLIDIGTGHTRTNPIDDGEVAVIIADAVRADGPREVTCGGPDVMTRREIFEAVAASVGQKRVRGFPVWLAGMNAAMLRLVHPRIGQFMQFAVGLAKHGVIAPVMGTKRFADHLASVANVSAQEQRDEPEQAAHRSQSN